MEYRSDEKIRKNLRLAVARLATTCTKRGADNAWKQLGHREREAVYQRALAAELEASGWTVEIEAPITVIYKTLRGTGGGSQRTVVLSHDRADILAYRSGFFVIIEVKKGGFVKEAKEQAARYSIKLSQQGKRVAGFVVARFSKKSEEYPLVSGEENFWEV